MKLLFLLLLLTLTLFAHKLNLFYSAESGELYIQGYFASGAPCKECEIKLKDSSGATLLSSTTDKNGEATLPLPKNLHTISLYGGLGHGASVPYESSIDTSEKVSAISNKNGGFNIGSILLGIIAIVATFALLYGLKRR